MSTSTEQVPPRPPQVPRRRPSGVVLVSVAALALVLVLLGASTFWMVQSLSHAPAARPTVRPGVTITPAWVPTPITPPDLAIFYDIFVNNAHGWLLGSNAGYFRIMVNNSLILADTNPNTPLVESAPTINLDNYVVSTDFTLNQGDANDGLGLYLRGDSTLDHDYRVDINGNGTVALAKEYLDAQRSLQETYLVQPERTGYLNPPGQPNTLTVIMIGSQITVEINSIIVMTSSDTTYTNGQIALFVRHGYTSRGVTVTFTRFEIDRLATRFMTPTPTPTSTPTATVTAEQP